MGHEMQKNYEPRLLKCGIRTLVGALAVVALLVLPGRAFAATAALSLVATNYPATTFEAWYTNNAPTVSGPFGTFTDTWTFSVTTPSWITLSNNGTSTNLFSNFQAVVNDSTPTALFTAPNLTYNTPVSLAIGNYSLVVTGAALTNPVAGYSGHVTLQNMTAPIPEPETYAMMLAGLGLMGFVARRRKQKEAA